MPVDKNRLGRLDRANPKKKKTATRSLGPAELMIGPDGRPRPWVLADQARRLAEEAAAAAQEKNASRLPEAAQTPATPQQAAPADAEPPAPISLAPQTSPSEPKWFEELCRWRSRDASEPYAGDEVRYQTIHKYDPIERALRQEKDDAEDGYRD